MRVSFATSPRGEGSANEDYVLATPDFVAVLDGAGVPPGTDTGCVHGLRWFVRRLAHELSAASENSASLRETLREGITRTAEAHISTCDPLNPFSPSATVALLRRSEGLVEWLVLSDATLLLSTSGGIRVVTDQRLQITAQEERDRVVLGPQGESLEWSALVSAERALRNRPGGYWVAAGEPQAADHAYCGSLPDDVLLGAALMSDGAACPVDVFDVLSWEECFAQLSAGGPAAWIEYVRDLERSDLERARWPRPKPHDDATVALVEIVGLSAG